nr:MAG TPA: hypothetical protein [Caudoviricetes sp.]
MGVIHPLVAACRVTAHSLAVLATSARDLEAT